MVTNSGAMKSFKQQPLRKFQTVGEQLRIARQSQGLDRAAIARKIKVPERYLQALEDGRYADLPSPVYIKNYLKLYVKELSLRWERVEEQYAQEVKVHHPDAPGRISTKRRDPAGPTPYQRKPLVVPTLFKYGAAAIVVVLFGVYFAWEITQLLTPPELEITYPAEDIIVTERRIVLEGKTEPETLVEINGQAVSVEPDGTFTEDIYLNEGLNTLRITAKSKRSAERVVDRNILYNLEAGEGR